MPPVDAAGEAQRRANILTAIASGATLREVGLSPATFSRWRNAYKKDGLKGLEPQFAKCGRKPMAVMDQVEQMMAKKLYAQTGSVTLALRTLANSELCSEATAAAILKKRTSKHKIPLALRHATKLPQAVADFAKSPKDVRVNSFINPRTLTYLDPLGKERELLVGDLSERDDMSNNFIGWVDWPWGGDPCSDRYGVRIFRGQNLMQIDVRSLCFQSFCFLVRLRDSYRADDIWQWVGRSYRDMFVPMIGERWERGVWASNKLRGFAIEAGHTSDEQRLGGIAGLGRRIIESQSPTTKIIENRFKFLQTVSSTIPGQIGRTRGEMERENKLWTECRAGRRDPREHFLSFEQLSDAIEHKLQFVNHEPVEGLIYRGIPAEIYAKGLAERADVLKPLAPEHAYLFSRDRRESTVTKSHALVRYTRPDGGRAGWWFHSLELMKHEGVKMAIYMDTQCPEAGATLVPMRPLHPGEKELPRIQCEMVDGMPQFAMGVDLECGRGATAGVDGLERKKAFMDAVRSEYRALGLGPKRIARASQVQDGAGGSATIEFMPRRHKAETPDSRGGGEFLAMQGRQKTRSTARPLSDDAAYMERLEKEFHEANPGLAIT